MPPIVYDYAAIKKGLDEMNAPDPFKLRRKPEEPVRVARQDVYIGAPTCGQAANNSLPSPPFKSGLSLLELTCFPVGVLYFPAFYSGLKQGDYKAAARFIQSALPKPSAMPGGAPFWFDQAALLHKGLPMSQRANDIVDDIKLARQM